MSSYFILLPILLPVVLGALSLKIAFKSEDTRSKYAFFASLFTSISVIAVLFFLQGTGVKVFTFTPILDIAFKVDGLSMVFAAMVSFLWPLAVWYAGEYMKHEGKQEKFFAFYLMTYGVTLGLAFSANMLTLYLFYELLTLITLPLVTHAMDKKSLYAGKKYLVYSVGGASLSFMGMMMVLFTSGTLDFVYGGVVGQSNANILVGYLLMFVGFGVKAAIFPLHGWLPGASVAPTTVTALLHAVAVVKAGVFAIMRTTFFLFGTEILKGTYAQTIVMMIAIITICYGSWMAVRSKHLKRRLAYSTISQLSYILFGITLMTANGLKGSLAHMLFHAIVKIVLFYTAGAILYTNHKEYVSDIEGYAYKMPKTFALFTICSLSLIGIPPFVGFLSKFTLATAAVAEISPNNILPLVGVCALMFSAFMTGIYLLEIVTKAYFPSKDFDKTKLEKVKEAPNALLIPMAIITIVMVLTTFWSNNLFAFLEIVAKGGI